MKKAQQSLQWQLDEADEVLAERGVLIEALEVLIRRHPDLRDEVLSAISDEKLRSELAGLLVDPPPPATEDESLG